MQRRGGHPVTHIPFCMRLVRDFQARFMDSPRPAVMGKALDVERPMGIAPPFYSICSLLLEGGRVRAEASLPLICWALASVDERAARVRLTDVETNALRPVRGWLPKVFAAIDRCEEGECLIGGLDACDDTEDVVAMHLDPGDTETLEAVRGFIWCKGRAALEIESHYLTLMADWGGQEGNSLASAARLLVAGPCQWQ